MMICKGCHTTLPDEAIACWKCGAPVASTAVDAPGRKVSRQDSSDALWVVFTFFGTVAFFVCLGWAIPFTVWGKINSAAMDNPQSAGLIGAVSGIAFVVTAIAVLGGFWWGSYWVITRISASPRER